MSPAKNDANPTSSAKPKSKTTTSTKTTARTKKEVLGGANTATLKEKDEDSADVAFQEQPEKQTDSSNKVGLAVPLSMIVMPKSQPRRYFDISAQESLVTSVKREGILQPVLLRTKGDKYELVAGERRYLAAQKAGLTVLPAVVREMTDVQAMEYAITENLQRENLNPIEETEAILDLLALKLEVNRELVITHLNKLSNKQRGKVTDSDVRPEAQQTIEDVFASIGRISPEAFRTHRLPLLNLPGDILSTLREGRIEYTKAREIAKLKCDSDRAQLLSDAIELSLSLSEVKDEVKKKKPQPDQTPLQSRLESTYKKAKQLKVWDDPNKQDRLKSLLAELEALIGEGG